MKRSFQRNAASVAIEESALPDMTQRHAPKKRRIEGRRHHKTDSMNSVSKRRSSYGHLPILLLGNPFGNPKDRMTDKSSYLAGPY
eukprot:scaffold21042_cov75-Skeletonema_marinoi.AAC.1